MADRGTPQADVAGRPDDWPAQQDLSLALNNMGSFDWDLDSGLFHLDTSGMAVFDFRPGEFDGRIETISRRIPPFDLARLDARVAQTVKDSGDSYGLYFRIRARDGSLRWLHTQAHIGYAVGGRPTRIIGIVRHADQDVAEAATRNAPSEGGPEPAGVVDRITRMLAHATTVQDVTDVLKDEEALRQLRVMNVILGVVEGTKIRIATQTRIGSGVAGLSLFGIDAQLPMSEAVRTLRPRYVASREEFRSAYPVLWPSLEELPVGYGVFLPLIAQDRAVGVLGLLYAQHSSFGAEDRVLLLTLASSIAQSLQRAIFFEQEHHLADSLQRAMLPRTIPEIPGARIAVRYASARVDRRSIGGDWYDVIPLPGNRVSLTIGDVQGHDTDAAVVMGQLRNAIYAYAAEGHPPATVMARASVFLDDLDTSRFATCTYVEVDLSTGKMEAVRAGHFSPLLRRADGTCHWFWTVGGLPLGLSSEFAPPGGVNYPVTTGWFRPGDTLLLCTDGLVEDPGTYLGDSLERLRQTVRTGPEDVEELASLLRQSVGDLTDGDDMALLLMRRDGRTSAS